jgi:hypothetical protein
MEGFVVLPTPIPLHPLSTQLPGGPPEALGHCATVGARRRVAGPAIEVRSCHTPQG